MKNAINSAAWKFANDTAESDDGEETRRCGSRLLFTRGYSVFNASQVDGYTTKPGADTPIEQRIEQAEQFFRAINARVIHSGNRAFYSPADDTITLLPFGAFFTAMEGMCKRMKPEGAKKHPRNSACKWRSFNSG